MAEGILCVSKQHMLQSFEQRMELLFSFAQLQNRACNPLKNIEALSSSICHPFFMEPRYQFAEYRKYDRLHLSKYKCSRSNGIEIRLSKIKIKNDLYIVKYMDTVALALGHVENYFEHKHITDTDTFRQRQCQGLQFANS